MLKDDLSIGSYRFKLTLEARKAFKKLYEVFINSLVVRHFNPDKKIKIIMDISKIS
jgi:hypothetical protein